MVKELGAFANFSEGQRKVLARGTDGVFVRVRELLGRELEDDEEEEEEEEEGEEDGGGGDAEDVGAAVAAEATRCLRDFSEVCSSSTSSMTLVETSVLLPLLHSLLLLNDSPSATVGLKPLQRRVISHVVRSVSANVWKGVRCEAYGSTANGLATGASDIDVSIYIPKLENARRESLNPKANKPRPGQGQGQGQGQGRHTTRQNTRQQSDPFFKKQKSATYKLAEFLKRSNFLSVVPIPYARVPVVKAVDSLAGNPFTTTGHLSVDICFDNKFAVANSRLVRAYAKQSPLLRKLMLLVKVWTKRHGVSDASDGTPSSYCWVVMCIFFGQKVGLVGDLQGEELLEEMGVERVEINGLDCSFYDDSVGEEREGGLYGKEEKEKEEEEEEEEQQQKQKQQKQQRHEVEGSIIALLGAFFVFYGKKFNRAQNIITIHRSSSGGPAKGEKRRMLRTLRARKRSLSPEDSANLNISGVCRFDNWFCVEDPFETFESVMPHDLMQVVSEAGMEKVEERLRMAAEVVERGEFDGNVNVWRDLMVVEEKGKKKREKKPKKKTPVTDDTGKIVILEEKRTANLEANQVQVHVQAKPPNASLRIYDLPASSTEQNIKSIFGMFAKSKGGDAVTISNIEFHVGPRDGKNDKSAIVFFDEMDAVETVFAGRAAAGLEGWEYVVNRGRANEISVKVKAEKVMGLQPHTIASDNNNSNSKTKRGRYKRNRELRRSAAGSNNSGNQKSNPKDGQLN